MRTSFIFAAIKQVHNNNRLIRLTLSVFIEISPFYKDENIASQMMSGIF